MNRSYEVNIFMFTSLLYVYKDIPAFRAKMRADALAARYETEPTAYEQHARLAREIATVLRQNIVQARRVDESGEERWRTFLPFNVAVAYTF